MFQSFKQVDNKKDRLLFFNIWIGLWRLKAVRQFMVQGLS